VQLRDDHSALLAVGGRLALIGSGTVEQAAATVAKYNIDYLILSDAQRVSFKAAGMRRDLVSTFNPRALGHLARSFRKGFRQGRTQGDAFQQGGAMIVDKRGNLIYQFIAAAGGQHPPTEELITAITHARQ